MYNKNFYDILNIYFVKRENILTLNKTIIYKGKTHSTT